MCWVMNKKTKRKYGLQKTHYMTHEFWPNVEREIAFTCYRLTENSLHLLLFIDLNILTTETDKNCTLQICLTTKYIDSFACHCSFMIGKHRLSKFPLNQESYIGAKKNERHIAR